MPLFHLVLECEELKVDSYRCFDNQDPNHNRRDYKFRWKGHKLIPFLSNPTLNPLLGLDELEEHEDVDDEDVTEEQDDDVQQTFAEADDNTATEMNPRRKIQRCGIFSTGTFQRHLRLVEEAPRTPQTTFCPL